MHTSQLHEVQLHEVQLPPGQPDQVDQVDFAAPRAAAKARCADGHGTLTHLFFSEELIDIARAKAICGKCRLREPCLQQALEQAEPWGVWGGQLVEAGRVVADKRPRGRPPKHPRPLLVVDEVPIPPHLVA